MFDRLKKGVSREALRNNRYLSFIGERLFAHELWHLERGPVARGSALGAFFAFVTPVAQIPITAAMCVVLRANVPAGLLATLLNTPLTFAPVYWAAHQLGKLILQGPLEASLLVTTAVGSVLLGASAAAIVASAVHLAWHHPYLAHLRAPAPPPRLPGSSSTGSEAAAPSVLAKSARRPRGRP
jgi:uncharacterized protein (DUF2062 family)